jgi:hypothetical protein
MAMPAGSVMLHEGHSDDEQGSIARSSLQHSQLCMSLRKQARQTTLSVSYVV